MRKELEKSRAMVERLEEQKEKQIDERPGGNQEQEMERKKELGGQEMEKNGELERQRELERQNGESHRELEERELERKGAQTRGGA